MDPSSRISGDGGPHVSTASTPSAARSLKLSYKFQRLRERIRQAVASGELSGKLPGERQLSRRFRVNAKTLSKALTDLAAEGVLERSIGRGTFVKGSELPATASAERWMLLCDSDQIHSPVVQGILRANPAAQVATDTSAMRPSYINQFKAAIDLSSVTPQSFVRDLVVRGMNVLLVGREPSTYSTHAVLIDRALAGAQLARDLMLGGHRRFMVIERRGQNLVANAVRNTASRYATDAAVEVGEVTDLANAIEQGVTAFICGTCSLARQVREQLVRMGVDVPAQASVAAIGTVEGEQPCSGYFVPAEQKVQTILQLLRDKQPHRPTTIWLTGTFTEGGTIAPRVDLIDAVAGTQNLRLNTVSA